MIGYLRRHERIHAGKKTFKCSFCPKRFCQHRDMKLHMSVHTGDSVQKFESLIMTNSRQSQRSAHNRFTEFTEDDNLVDEVFSRMMDLSSEHTKPSAYERFTNQSSSGGD